MIVERYAFVALTTTDLERARRFWVDQLEFPVTEEEPGRHWWSNPFSWIGVAVFLVLGLFVFPRLLGITFVFLPLVWIGGLRRRRREG